MGDSEDFQVFKYGLANEIKMGGGRGGGEEDIPPWDVFENN